MNNWEFRFNKSDFLITAGLAGIAAGSMSMAVGEYVSVKSQNDIETADREIEIKQLATDPEGEFEELVEIYMKRGLARQLATEVVTALHKQDPLEAHLRDELGHFDHTRARPLQAGVASAIAFTAGGVIPLLGALISKSDPVALVLIFTAIGLVVAGFVSANKRIIANGYELLFHQDACTGPPSPAFHDCWNP